jgi:hypothetical protein
MAALVPDRVDQRARLCADDREYAAIERFRIDGTVERLDVMPERAQQRDGMGQCGAARWMKRPGRRLLDDGDFQRASVPLAVGGGVMPAPKSKTPNDVMEPVLSDCAGPCGDEPRAMMRGYLQNV